MAMDGFDMGSHDRATGGQMPDRNHPWHQSNDAARNAEVRQYFKIFVLFDLGFFDVPVAP